MPKPTFLNLKPDKKESFLQRAFAEFSLQGFHGASLTRLVKDLRMAKGSLYQYFDDKVELYNFLIEEACRRRIPYFEALRGKPQDDFQFNYLIISLKFDLTYPHLACLLYNGLTTFRPEFIAIIEAEFSSKIPDGSARLQIPLLLLACANFIDLTRRASVDLPASIRNGNALKLSSSEILQIIQKNNLKI